MQTPNERALCYRSILATAALALAAPCAHAGLMSYHCDIATHTALLADGKLGKPIISSAGQRLAVDRTTGRVLGPNAPWVSFPQEGGQSTVLSRGNDENGFAATHHAAAGKGGAWFMTIYVHEHHKGDLKPFLLISNDEVLTGTCR